MVDDECGGGAALVVLRQHGVVLVGGEGPVDRVAPREHWRGLAAAPDLPEGRPVHAHRLRASLALVDGRSH